MFLMIGSGRKTNELPPELIAPRLIGPMSVGVFALMYSVDVGDIAQVTWSRAAVNAQYALEALNLGLAPDATMTLTARRRSS